MKPPNAIFCLLMAMTLPAFLLVGCSVTFPPMPDERKESRDVSRLEVDVRELTARVKTLELQVNALRKP